MQPKVCIQTSTFNPVGASPVCAHQAHGQGERRRSENVVAASSRTDTVGVCRRVVQKTVPTWTSACQKRSARLRVSAEGSLQEPTKRPKYIPSRIDDPKYIRIFDTTLRDGEQSPGATLTSQEKLAIAQQLSKLGVDVIEAGFPRSSPADLEAVRTIAREVGNNVDENGYVPVICGLARCTKADIDTAWEGVRGALRPRLHVFIATSPIHMEYKLQKTPDEVVQIATEMVAYARSLGCEDIEFSPEDAGRSEPEFLYRILEEVIKVGATTLNIPDTVGYTMPSEYGELISMIKANTPGIENVVISTHCQNDLGLATANTLAGAKAGARQVEVTINGIGKRAGNASLEEVVMALRCRGQEQFGGLYTGITPRHIASASQMVSEYTGMVVQPHKAIVGANAFAHESGIHQDGTLETESMYDMMVPEDIGLVRSDEAGLVLNELSGRQAAKTACVMQLSALAEGGSSGGAEDYESESDSIVSSIDEELSEAMNSPKAVDDKILAQAYASSLSPANPVEGPVEDKPEDSGALVSSRPGGFRPHINGLHSLWRGLRTQMRASAVSPPLPSDEQQLESVLNAPTVPPAPLPEKEKTPAPEQAKDATNSRKTSSWAMSALLNWRRELQQERLQAVGGVVVEGGSAALKGMGDLAVAGGCSGAQNLIDCPSCAGFAPGEVVLAPSPSSAVSVPQDARGTMMHTRETFSRFLLQTSLVEMKTVALMAMLCDMAYSISNIKESLLFREHRLRLITSSKAIAAKAAAAAAAAANTPKPAAEEAKKESDASSGGGSILFPSSAYAFATAAASYIASQSRGILPSSGPKPNANAEETKLLAATPTATVASAEPMIAGAVASFSDTTPEALDAAALPTLVAVASGAPTVEALAAAPALEPMNGTNRVGLRMKQQGGGAVAPAAAPVCPCEWFVCDDNGTHTRYFVIQGSDSLASWQANISFDPVVFEEKSLGVLVHRGIYEAAQALYTQLLPLVRQHIRSHGEAHARFRFTGHSLGGSLAALISLMLHIRHAVPKSTLEPVYTFGSPSIMCGGDFLLERLGLSQDHILSVAMHRDIVPRAFACDYPDHVAEVLRRMSGSFRDHPCLLRQRLMYAPMGVMMVLQPDEKQAPPHPLLPEGAGLYRIRHPDNSEASSPIPDVDQECSLGGSCSTEEASEDGTVKGAVRPLRVTRAAELRAAQRAILNHPHPLEILSDPGAYGFEGAISRDHDPGNYHKIVNQVLRQESRRWRGVQREQRKQLWWPLVGAEAAAAASQDSNSGRLSSPGLGDGSRSGPAGSHMAGLARSPSLRQVQTVAGRAISADVGGGSYGKSSSSIRTKDRSRRYSRLVASQHVHLGGLAIALMYPLGIVADLGTYFTGI